ncbi:MAG: sulfatase [Opitutaceae bacterium]|nr:sulfatase [Opitutaceae bacterium]
MRALPLLLAAVGSALAPAVAAERPNIVLILADDLGWRDLRCTGSPWHDTPHLDRLAAQGMRFTQAYAPAPICSASRAAILTGRSPARLGFEFVVKDSGAKLPSGLPLTPPPYPRELPLSEISVAEVLGPAGYATGFYGKWHLNQHGGSYLSWSTTHGPLQQGFAEGAADFGSHAYGDLARGAGEKDPLPAGDYGRDTLIEKAVSFLRAHRREPFFLYLSHYYVHDPIRTRAQWLVDKYAARLPAGADPLRAGYAAMVETLDHLAGQVLRALDELGLADKTLVVFTSDNGGHPRYSANGPLRGSKWNLHEAGLRVPWIVRWPGRVRAGATSDAPIIGTDLLPTFCAAAGVALPAGVALDGRNLLPLWRGEAAADTTRELVWHFPFYHPEGAAYAKALPRIGTDDFAVSRTHPQSAIRVGSWKLHHDYEAGYAQLFDLAADPGEQRDLSAAQPGRARDLRARLDASLRSASARFPTPSAPPPVSPRK